MIKTFKNINFKLYLSLLFFGFCPAIYNIVRVFLLGQIPDSYVYSIAGQIAWLSLIYEILNEFLILPLYNIIGKVANDKKEMCNRVKGGLIIIFTIFTLLSLLVIAFVKPILMFMQADSNIINQSIKYIRIESIANIFVTLNTFLLTIFTIKNDKKTINSLTILRLFLSVLCDITLISPKCLNLGVNGIGYSNINCKFSFISYFFIHNDKSWTSK